MNSAPYDFCEALTIWGSPLKKRMHAFYLFYLSLNYLSIVYIYASMVSTPDLKVLDMERGGSLVDSNPALAAT